MKINTKSLGPIMGIQVEGLDCSKPQSKQIISKLEKLLTKYQLVVFRNQHLNETEYLNFAKNFGRLAISKVSWKNKKHKHISIVSNIKKNNRRVGVIAPQEEFHADGHDTIRIYKRLLLYGLIIPAKGGDTLFANARLAYKTWPKQDKKKFKNKRVMYEHIQVTEGYPPPIHPLVVSDPVSKQKALLAIREYAIKIKGMNEEESMVYINSFYKHVTKLGHIYKHHWHSNDLVIWDNRSLLHAATRQIKRPRLLWRIELY